MKPEYWCICKAAKDDSDRPQYSEKWILSTRAVFKVFEDRIVFGRRTIPFDDMETVMAFRTRQWFIPITVLKVVSPDNTYQFGFNPWADPTPHIKTQISEEWITIGYSKFSLVLRLGAALFAAWYLL